MYARAGIVLALWVVACDKVTAPEARDVASNAQRDLAAGNLSAFFSIAGRMGKLQSLLTGWPDARNSGLVITRDGRREVLNAYVIENVYVPPTGLGKPIVHRALAAWPETREFALAVVAERHPSELSTDTTSGTWDYLPEPNPSAFARVHVANPDHRWIPQAGTVLIGEPVVDRPCSTAAAQVFQQYVDDKVTCELALFDVRMEGEFARAVDLRSSRLWRIVTRHRRLTIASQRVPGIRFVTSCSEPPREFWLSPNFSVQPCYPGFDNWMRYWRHNELFATRLGVDVAAMSRSANLSNGTGTIYGRVIPTDKEKSHGKYVRWTLHLPDGTRFDAGSFPLEYPGDRAHFPIPEDRRRDLVKSWAAPFCNPLTCGRVQALVPAYFLTRDASRYAVMVLHTEPSAVP